MNFTRKDALQAYAQMLSTLSVEPFAWKLAKNFHYSSAWVFEELQSRDEYLSYIRPKLKAIKASGSLIWTRLGYWGDQPCLALAQGSADNHLCTVFAKVRKGMIAAISLQIVPTLYDVEFR